MGPELPYTRFQGLFNYTPVHWYNRAKQNSGDPSVDSPVLVLGFPHGKQLYTTLGRLRDVERKGEWLNTTVQYSADSCVGNSGGLVLPVARLSDDGVFKSFMLSHPHSGATTTPGVGLSAGWEVGA